MKSFVPSDRNESHSRRHNANRRKLKKASLVLLVLGLVCPVVGLVLLARSMFFIVAHGSTMRTIGWGYIGAGVLILVVHWVMEKKRKTRYIHEQPRKKRIPVAQTEGSVLILVLVLLGLAAALVAQVQLKTRAALQHERQTLLSLQLRQAAGEAARQALQQLAEDEDLLVDHAQEHWALPQETATPAGIATLVKVTDENRFFDLNNLAVAPTNGAMRPPSDILMDILTLCGDFTPVEKTEALLDWVDGNAEGAYESIFYQQKAPPYQPANRVLYASEELFRVQGFGPEAFARHDRVTARASFKANLAECVTIIPEPRTLPVPINLNTASPDVLLGVLGLSQDKLVRTVLGVRAIQPLRSADILLAATTPEIMEALRPFLAVNSRYFRVEARAYSEGRAENLRVLACRQEDGAVSILQWVY